VSLLLESGQVDPDVLNDHEASPLHLAAAAGHEEVCRLLLDHGAPADAKDAEGYSPLALAVRQGHPETLLCMIEAGVGNLKERVGPERNTLLHIAAESGSELVVEVLVSAGEGAVKVDARNEDGATPLQVACARGHLAVVKVRREVTPFRAELFLVSLHCHPVLRRTDPSKCVFEVFSNFVPFLLHVTLHHFYSSTAPCGPRRRAGGPPRPARPHGPPRRLLRWQRGPRAIPN
jgi:hypothetical protein